MPNISYCITILNCLSFAVLKYHIQGNLFFKHLKNLELAHSSKGLESKQSGVVIEQ